MTRPITESSQDSRLTGTALVADGDLLRYENGAASGEASTTQQAVLTLLRRLKLGPEDLLAALRQEKREAFARTQLYLQREAMPRIELKSPKIRRKLTTAWFAERVNLRYRACMTRAPEARR